MVETAGLTATCNLGQPFAFERACGTCGAGATPVEPLFVDATRMGKKALDATAHDLRIVVRRELAELLISENLSGFTCLSVAHKTATRFRLDERFVWLEPTFEWPALHELSILAVEDPCPTCGRAGHFDSPSPPTSLCYGTAPRAATDFGATYEYFGRWRAPGRSSPSVGGGRLTIVSARFKAALVAGRVRHVSFEPVQLLERSSGHFAGAQGCDAPGRR